MKKRKAYRPKPVNPLAHMAAIVGTRPLERDDILRFVAPIDAAVEAAREARAGRDEWRAVFGAINVIEELILMGVAQDEHGAIEDMQRAVVSALDRAKATGIKALKADELSLLVELRATYTDLLCGITHRQLYDAAARSEARVARVLRHGPRAGESVSYVPKEFAA